MRAGNLSTRLTLQSKSVTRDSEGGEVITWTDVTTFWAELEPWTMRDRVIARRQQGEAVIAFRARTPLALSLDKRVLFEGTGYDLVEIDVTKKSRGEIGAVARGEDAAP
jgi:SPP1 family predicted phage head-tail adaptor